MVAFKGSNPVCHLSRLLGPNPRLREKNPDVAVIIWAYPILIPVTVDDDG